jgi:membrane protein DedA with SNARE-associated domain
MEFLHSIWTYIAEGTIPLLGFWSYVVIAILVALEGPSITILAALLAATGALDPILVFVAASIGNLCADIGWYLLGYLGRFERLKVNIGWLRKHEQRINRLEFEMKQHALKILLVAKLTLSMSVPALIAAGMARVPFRRWFPAIFLAECVWTGSLTFIGYNLGEYITQLQQGMQVLAIIGLLIFIGFTIWLIKRIRQPSQFDTA